MNKSILEESLQDLKQDFEELIYLFSSSLKQLQQFQKDITKQKKHILSYDVLLQQIKYYEKRYKDSLQELHKFPKLVQDEEIKQLLENKSKYVDLYRSLQNIVAGLITATDWQSPSFNHSLTSSAGRQTGKILANYNDYKRDQHIDAKLYAEKFRNEYLEGLWKFSIPTYLVNSGMAALTTILNFLEMERKITGPILLGSSSYFQNKELINKLFTGVIEIHEHETEKIKEVILTKKPAVLFFDSLCNSHDIAIPNLKEIIETIRQTQDDSKKDVYIIIDNTCLATSFQPLQLLGKFPKHIHMIVFESLNKYYQFGLDKTMGGIIYAFGKDTEKLFFARQHSGTIISDINCSILPYPNKIVLKKRLERHERNVKIIIAAVNEFLTRSPKHPVKELVYPTSQNHPAYEWSKNLVFHGSYFTFSFHPKHQTIRIYQKLIKNVLSEAKKQKVQITEGTSFGLNTSRIYLTAKNTKFGKPFVRFSVGTETRYEIEKIKHVLFTALNAI